LSKFDPNLIASIKEASEKKVEEKSPAKTRAKKIPYVSEVHRDLPGRAFFN